MRVGTASLYTVHLGAAWLIIGKYTPKYSLQNVDLALQYLVKFSYNLMWPCLADYWLPVGRPSLFYSIIGCNKFCARWIWILSANLARTHTQRQVFCPACLCGKSGAPHAAVCGHCAVPRCLDRSQSLLWPTFSVWCLSLFINVESVTVAQKPEMAVSGLREGGEHPAEFVFLC